MPVQKQVNILPIAGMPGDLFKNPLNVFGALAKEPVTIGTGVWGDQRKYVVNNKSNTGSSLSLFLGFIINNRDNWLVNITDEAMQTIPAGQPVSVLTEGAIIVKSTATGSVEIGDYVAVSATDGTIQTQDNKTTTIANHVFIDGWTVIEIIDEANKIVAISNVDNTFHVGTVPTVTRGLQPGGN